jgi:hypothetical protein
MVHHPVLQLPSRRSQIHAEKSRLILVDRSVWIDFLSSSPSPAGAELRRMIGDAEPFAFSGVVVTEVFEGLKRDVSHLEHYLSEWDMLEPRDFRRIEKRRPFFGLRERKVLRLRPSML